MGANFVLAVHWAEFLLCWVVAVEALIRFLRKPRKPREALSAKAILFRVVLVVIVGFSVAYEWWGSQIDKSAWGEWLVNGFCLGGCAWIIWLMIIDRRRQAQARARDRAE